MARFLKTWAWPFVGLSFFWGFFRHQSFFGALYPLNANGQADPMPLYGLYVACLVACSVVALIAERPLRSRMQAGSWRSTRVALIAVATLLGFVGVLLCLFAQDGAVAPWLPAVAAPLIAVCFCSQFLGWASYCCRTLSPQTLIVMTASFFASLACIVAVTRLSTELNDIAVALTPVVSGAALIAIGGDSQTQQASESTPSASFVAELAQLFRDIPLHVVLFVAFLLCGAIIRGIVDVRVTGAPGIRWPVSLALTAAMLALCLVLYAHTRGKENAGEIMTEKFILITWIAMATLFSAGVVWGIATDSLGHAGQLVVVARSILDFVLMVVMCDVASRWTGRRATVFLTLGIGTEALSLLLSYVVVPALLAMDAQGEHGIQQTLELGALLALLVSMVVAFAVLGAFGAGRRPGDADDAGRLLATSASFMPTQQVRGPRVAGEAQGAQGTQGLRGTQELQESQESHYAAAFDAIARDYRLTPREAQVVELFSQGYSVKRVAEYLGVSLGTVQSHLKGAYRKLQIHSRDELIELVQQQLS